MDKEKIAKGIEWWKSENEIEVLPFEDMFEHWPSIGDALQSPLDFDSVTSYEGSDTYTIATYYIDNIGSIVLSWAVKNHFDSEIECIAYLVGLVDRGELIKNKVTKYK